MYTDIVDCSETRNIRNWSNNGDNTQMIDNYVCTNIYEMCVSSLYLALIRLTQRIRKEYV